MQAWHQKEKLERDFPVWLFIGEFESFPPHWHEEIEIIYIIEGKIRVGINREIFTLNKGDILFINSGDVHHVLPRMHENKIAIIELSLSFLGCLSDEIYGKRLACSLISNSANSDMSCDRNINSLLESHINTIINEYERKEKGYQMAVKAKLYDFLTVIIRNFPLKTPVHKNKSRQIYRLDRLEKVFRYVEDNYEKDIGLEDVSKAINYSVFYFTRFFRETTGMTFKEYLDNFRISKAIWYLMNTDYPVTKIALETGFNSIKTFNRVFKSKKGCSPINYKKQFLRSE